MYIGQYLVRLGNDFFCGDYRTKKERFDYKILNVTQKNVKYGIKRKINQLNKNNIYSNFQHEINQFILKYSKL